MGLEAATRIEQLDPNNPVGGTDQVSQGDDHLRMIKQCLRNSFPNFSNAVTVTDAQINAAVTTIAALAALTAGNHVPVCTGVSNSTGPAANQKYIRVGNTVFVIGALGTTIVAGVTQTRIQLPVASNLGVFDVDLFGVVTGPSISVGRAQADIANDAVLISATSAASGGAQLYYAFAYTVI